MLSRKSNFTNTAPMQEIIDRAMVDLRPFFADDDNIDPQYIRFVLQHGAGTLGRAKIFAPTVNVSHPADIRLHALLMRRRCAETTFQHSFEMSSLLPFAFDTREGMWYAWSVSGKRKSLERVLVFDTAPDAPPPRVVAENFAEFLRSVALGNRMIELDIKKPRNVSDGEDDDAAAAADAAVDRDYVPPKTFVRFADR